MGNHCEKENGDKACSAKQEACLRLRDRKEKSGQCGRTQVVGSRIQDEAGKVGFGQVTKGPDNHSKVLGVQFAGRGKA